MSEEELTEVDMRVFSYLESGDFETEKWSTPSAAEKLGLPESEIYKSLSNLTKYHKDHIYIYYKDGGLRIATE